MGESPTTTTESCLLLDKLPVELRITIYELVFEPDDDEVNQTVGLLLHTVNIFKAKTPSSNLLLTCHKIRSEAARTYRAACRTYWRTTPFCYDMRDFWYGQSPGERLHHLRVLKKDDMDLITKLRVIQRSNAPLGTITSTLLDSRGGWKWACDGLATTAFLDCRYRIYRYEDGPGGMCAVQRTIVLGGEGNLLLKCADTQRPPSLHEQLIFIARVGIIDW